MTNDQNDEEFSFFLHMLFPRSREIYMKQKKQKQFVCTNSFTTFLRVDHQQTNLTKLTHLTKFYNIPSSDKKKFKSFADITRQSWDPEIRYAVAKDSKGQRTSFNVYSIICKHSIF